MAKPRVFVSSTYFDLKAVRSDLEHFIREQGYDPNLHERGNVPYGKQESLEHYCYKEIESCDILVSVVGGRFGSGANNSEYSVSQTELRVALEHAKQVYVFVERAVFHEYRTYERNKDSTLKWASVDDARIFHFLDEIYKLKNNNAVQEFETSIDIAHHLKEQWAGLFQRLLAQSTYDLQVNILSELRHSLETSKSLVDVISSQADAKDTIVSDLVLTNHPLFSAIRNAANIPYRLLFYDIDEMDKWAEARGYIRDDNPFEDDCHEWVNTNKANGRISVLKLARSLFDDSGRLKPMLSSDWTDSMLNF